MKNKKLVVIASVVVILAVAVIIASRFYPPSLSADSSGTIGVVKKYNAGQMNEKDVKLKNIMLKDLASVQKAIDQLGEYKAFVNGLAQDLGKWNQAIESKKAKGLKEEKLLTDNAALYSEYKTYIEKNINILDNTINILTKITQKDTSGNQSIIAQLNEYENFRIQIAQKFETMMSQLPNVHNAFVKNGMKGIVGNKDNNLNIVVLGKETINLSEWINSSVTLGVGYYYNKDVQGNAATYNKDVQGNVATYSKDAQNQIIRFNKDVQGSNVTYNKDGSLGVVELQGKVIGVFPFNMKDGSLNAVLNKDNSLNCAMNKDNTLGCCLSKEMNYSIFTNKDSQLGGVFTNKQLGFVDPVE